MNSGSKKYFSVNNNTDVFTNWFRFFRGNKLLKSVKNSFKNFFFKDFFFH
jgi:hypothetical protein